MKKKRFQIQLEKMKIRIYQPKNNNGIAYTIKGLSDTHQFMYSYRVLIIVDPIVYIHHIDYGPIPEIDLPHLIAVKGGSIEMYVGSIIQIECKEKSEYWISIINGWHKID